MRHHYHEPAWKRSLLNGSSGSSLCENSFRPPRRIANRRIGADMSPEIASTWLKLTGKKRSREFSHSLGQHRPDNATAAAPCMPARFVIGQDGTIVCAEVKRDYTRSPALQELLPARDRTRDRAR
jgi:hypothetical protein